MKYVIALSFMALSLSAFAQSDALTQCRARVDRLRLQVQDLTARVNACELGGGSEYPGEVAYLRSENLRLKEQNRLLQIRIDELEGNGSYERFFCTAGCVDVNSRVDIRYMESGTAYTQLEADLLAKQTVQKTYTCNFGLKSYKCEPFTSDAQMSFCTAGCADINGRADERYSAGGRGRNKTEAEFLAIKELKKTYTCNFGVKVIACN